ncbi:MAG TPA: LptF/LptG family permease [Bacillota bacterium]|nr:LptF/LptG family permease [Bacillota bacterium]
MSKEFVTPFLGCIGGFILIILASQLFWLAELIIVKKIATGTVARLLLYKLPDAIAQSIPVSTLCGALLSLMRLGKDSELAALRTGGVRALRLVMPLLVLGLVASVASFAFNERVVPWANHEFENIIRRIILEEAIPTAEENVFFRATGDRFFYIRKVDQSSQELRDVLVYEAQKEGPPRIITAKSGSAKGVVWTLSDGVVHDLDAEGYVVYEAKFKEMSLRMDQESEPFFSGQKTPAEMSRRELKSYIDLFRTGGVDVSALIVDYQLKLALPFAAFIFVLTGAPIAIGTVSPKTGRSAGIALGGCISLLYYALSSILRSLGVSNVLPPFVAAWTGNIIFAVVGVALIVRSEQAPRGGRL